MARPADPDTLRLDTLDPADLARRVSERIASNLSRLAVALSPGYTLDLDGPHGDTGIGLTLADLARYARGEGGLDGPVSDYGVELAPVIGSLLAPPMGPLPAVMTRWMAGDVDVRTLSADSLEDAVALVIVAAFAREALDGGDPVTAGQLAALGGVDPRTVRRLIERGELDGDDGHVKPASALRWLSTRGGK